MINGFVSINIMVLYQLLASIIGIYPTSTHMSNEPVRWTIIGHLDDEAKLLDHFFNDIKYFKENCAIKDDAKYLAQIKERLQFLQYILSNTHTINFIW